MKICCCWANSQNIQADRLSPCSTAHRWDVHKLFIHQVSCEEKSSDPDDLFSFSRGCLEGQLCSLESVFLSCHALLFQSESRCWFPQPVDIMEPLGLLCPTGWWLGFVHKTAAYGASVVVGWRSELFVKD